MRLALLLLSLGVVGAPNTAAADAPGARTLFGNPVTETPELSAAEIEARRANFEAMMEERGWIVADDVIGPPELFAEPDPQAAIGAWEYAPHRGTMFLNFYGGEMSGGTNSALMQSPCFNGKIDYPGYTGSEAAALAMIEIFASRMEPYGIRVVYEKAPPPELPYQMVMMGGRPTDVGLPNGVLGVSCSSDCGDRWWRDTTLAFTGASSNSSLMGTTALQEAAHAFGLAHIDGSQHIMYPYASSGTKIWATECTPYNNATGPINCIPTHNIFCGGGAQNDDAELMAYFGPNSPDVVPPTVTILSPEDPSILTPGDDITVEAEITDDHEGVGWKIMIYQDGVVLDESPAFVSETTWGLGKLPMGTYVVRVQAIDHDRNIGYDEVTLYVGTEPPAAGTDTDAGTDGGTDGTGGTGPGTGGTGGSESGAGTGGATAGETGETGEPEGCACSSRGGAPTSGLWLLAGLLGLAARRRR